MKAFNRAVVVQSRVIGALMLRDLVAQGASGTIPFFPIFRRPVMMIAAFYLLGSAVNSFTPQGFPLLVFIITGYLTWMGFLRCFGAISIQGSTPLLMFPHVTPLDLMLAKVATEFVIYTMLFVVLCALGMLFEKAPMPYDPLGVLLAFWSAIAIGLALGMMAASLSRFTNILDDLWVFVRTIGHAASGVFALATDTPQSFLNFLRWNPLFHSVEWLRESWWGSYKSPIADPSYIGLCLFFMFAIGLAFERSTRRWQEQ